MMKKPDINTIPQIPVSYSTNGEYRKLIEELQKLDYRIYHSLDRIKDEDHIVAIIIDNREKCVLLSNVTCMACWCSANDAIPLNAEEFLSNLDILIKNPDTSLYRRMIETKKGQITGRADGKEKT
ncbi:MAG: hypothetical protein IIZ80_06675 [Erysipelotrichaceae bacterium]|nr:hypothetical protein [Erysipelotrichaceae bacterium]